jgi:hypothetical protein
MSETPSAAPQETPPQPSADTPSTSGPSAQPPPRKPLWRRLVNWIWPLIVGALVGIFLRLLFRGKPGNPFAAMDSGFILLAPLVVGAATVFVAEMKSRHRWRYYAGAGALANALFVIGTLAIMIEGWICAVIIIPVFALVGAIGGLLMGLIFRLTEWPKHAMYALAVMPIVVGAFPKHEDAHPHFESIERTIRVPAPPAVIWRQIHEARDIRPAEVDRGFIYRIGVPLPIAGVTEQTPTGLVRKVTMGKSVHFDQVIADWDENRYVRFTYRFYEDSFPPNALDEHVRIGGYYFDLIDTSYRLTPQDDGSSTLAIRMSYRVSTQFNWYANRVAEVLIGNFEETILEFYRNRSVASTAQSASSVVGPSN